MPIASASRQRGPLHIARTSCVDRIGSLSPWLCRYRRARSEEHTSELQSRPHLVCRLLLEKKKKIGCMALGVIGGMVGGGGSLFCAVLAAGAAIVYVYVGIFRHLTVGREVQWVRALCDGTR